MCIHLFRPRCGIHGAHGDAVQYASLRREMSSSYLEWAAGPAAWHTDVVCQAALTDPHQTSSENMDSGS